MLNGGVTHYLTVSTNASMRNDLTDIWNKRTIEYGTTSHSLLKNNKKPIQHLLLSPTIIIIPLTHFVYSDAPLNYLPIWRLPVIPVVFLLAILLPLTKFPKHTNLFPSLFSHHIIYFLRNPFWPQDKFKSSCRCEFPVPWSCSP